MSYVEATPVAEPRQRSWFRRNWWWVILLVFLLFILVCGGICGGVATFGIAMLKDSEPYKLALKQVREDPEVVKRLGEPIEDGLIPVGDVSTTNDRGSANLFFEVTGPKGSAKVMCQSQMVGGQWGLTQLEVTFDDGKRITIDTSAKAGDGGANDPGEAPLWKPNQTQ